MRVILRRHTELEWSEHNPTLLKDEAAITLPDDYIKDTYEESALRGNKFKYKIGDGIHDWKSLEYESESIPVYFEINPHPDRNW